MPGLYEKEDYIYNQIPVRILIHDLHQEEIYTPLHWHRGVELNLATGGRINMWIDGTNNEMHQGDWAIVNTGEFHLNTWVEPTDIYEGLTVLISRFFLDSWLKEDVRFVYPTDKKGRQEIREVLERFGELKRHPGAFSNLECMMLLYFLIRLLGQYCIVEEEKGSRADWKIEKIKEIINYIDDHYRERLTLEQVAEEFHYSTAYLSRMFKEHIGFNFYEYLQDVRLMNVMEELRKSENVLLLDCALEFGFPNVKSFITA